MKKHPVALRLRESSMTQQATEWCENRRTCPAFRRGTFAYKNLRFLRVSLNNSSSCASQNAAWKERAAGHLQQIGAHTTCISCLLRTPKIGLLMKPNCLSKTAATTLIGALIAAGCGGGGGASIPSASPVVGTPVASVASVVTPATGKTSWNLAAAAQFSLRDASGTAVGGGLTCTSDVPTALLVAIDCSSLTGRRLGAQVVTVAGGGWTAKATIKVIPQAQPLGSHGPSSPSGDGEINLVTTTDGHVLAWGANPNGALGQGLSASQLVSLSLPTAIKDSSGQALLIGIVAVSAGDKTGFALTEDGEIYSWGDNGDGILGRAASNGDPLLVKAASGAGLLNGITMVAAGGNHALALDSAGQVYSWGYSQNGELGDGANHPRFNQSALPGAVVSALGTGSLNGIAAVAAGYSHSLAFASDGSLLIWGSGFRGNLGQGGTNQSISFVPLMVKNEAGSAPLSLAPASYWPNLKQRGI